MYVCVCSGGRLTTYPEPIIQPVMRKSPSNLTCTYKGMKISPELHNLATSHWPRGYSHTLKPRTQGQKYPHTARRRWRIPLHWRWDQSHLNPALRGSSASQAGCCRGQGQWQTAPKPPQSPPEPPLLPAPPFPNTHPPLPDMAAAAPDPAPSPRQSWPGRTETREAGRCHPGSGGLEAVPHLSGAGVCDLGEEESSGGVVCTLRGQPRSARWGRAAGRSGGSGSLAPAPPKGSSCQSLGLGLKAGPRVSRGRGGCLLRRRQWGGGREKTSPPPPRGGGGHGAAGPNPGQEWGRSRRGSPQLLPQLLLLAPPTPEPQPAGLITPLRSGGGGQNEAGCGPASRRRACPGPAPGAGRRG